MLLYWLGDMWPLWAAIAAFGFHMNGASMMVAFGTAMIVTRRTGPLGESGSSASRSPRRSGTAARRGRPLFSEPSATGSSPSGRHSRSRSSCCRACAGLREGSPDADAPTSAERDAGERTEEPALKG
jgi:hypothetical protein